MNLDYKSIVLLVKDIQRSKDFYTKVLNQEIEVDFGKNVGFKSGIAIWELEPIHIIKKKISEKLEGNSNRTEIYFETEKLDETYQTLKNAKVGFVHEINEEPWGRRNIRFYDPDNHMIEIGESMKTFLKRFQDQGMSLEEISKRTFVPIEGVKMFLNAK